MSKNLIISLLDQKLNGPNYLHWLRSLKLLLTIGGRLHVLDERLPTSIPDTATDAENETYEAWKKDDTHARCYMIASMEPALARKYESHLHAFDIKSHLDSMYCENIKVSRYATTKE
ncbi:PREDICTED: uncharacterized protein LOC105961521 [Erythranthe guttata]|uniref:uncharacterized protein LOC105961521 n=1 Tax=Erythranthe guttata TaxID=4155 RepID=UPI00064DF952|nr:PREDICTED: uncharacterized protein LOC105961521 [Erythranthe guttata]|eukprot:XP_012841205.1 PREDICTED: uncharacterized protein LOC105961521 [Erythranthe guttata]